MADGTAAAAEGTMPQVKSRNLESRKTNSCCCCRYKAETGKLSWAGNLHGQDQQRQQGGLGSSRVGQGRAGQGRVGSELGLYDTRVGGVDAL